MFNGSACEGNACAAFVDGGSIFVWKLRKEDMICAAFVDGKINISNGDKS